MKSSHVVRERKASESRLVAFWPPPHQERIMTADFWPFETAEWIEID
jgi:hypothetical protein